MRTASRYGKWKIQHVPASVCGSVSQTGLEEVSIVQNEAILLMHFSARYKAQYIEDQLNNMLQPALRRKVTPFFEGFSLR